MTTETRHLLDAYRRARLPLLGYTFERALAVPAIRISLECAAKSQTKGKPAPIQPALI